MSKELSKQICEKCEVKPHYNCLNVPCLNFIGQTGICNISDEHCNLLHCKNYEPDTNHRNWKEGLRTYPDFGLPENFVKLLELKFNIEDTEWTILELLVLSESLGLTTRKEALFSINRFLEDDRYNRGIKQAIKEAEWIYA